MTVTNLPRLPTRRITAALFTSQAFFSAATSVVVAITSLTAVQLAGTEAIAGIPSALALVGRAAFAYPLGWILDRWGRRNGLSAGYLVGAVGSSFAALAIVQGSLIGFLVAMTITGMGRAASDQSRFVAAEINVASRRARAIGIIIFAGALAGFGAIPATALATGWATENGFSPFAGAMVATTLLTLAAAAAAWLLMRPEPSVIGRQIAEFERAATPPEQRGAADPTLREIFSKRSVQLAVFALVVGQGVMVSLMVVLPLHLVHLGDDNISVINFVLNVHTLGMFLVAPFTGVLADRFGRIQFILLGAVMLLIACVTAPLTPFLVPITISMFILGLGWNFTFVAASSLFADATRGARRGRAQGIGEAISSTASGVGAIGAGVLFGAGSFGLVGAIGGAAAAGLLIVFAVAFWRAQRPGPPDPQRDTEVTEMLAAADPA